MSITLELGGFPPETGPQPVDYWRSEGLIGSRPEISSSQEHARELRRRAERQTWK